LAAATTFHLHYLAESSLGIMSQSADNSMWSPVVDTSYASTASAWGYPNVNETKFDYPLPPEPDYDPLIPIPGTEAEKQGASSTPTLINPFQLQA